MLGMLVAIATAIGVATYFLCFDRDEAQVMNTKIYDVTITTICNMDKTPIFSIFCRLD